MEQQKEKEKQVCHECRKKLLLKPEANMSYVILNKDQFFMNESTLFGDPFRQVSELRKGGEDKEQILYHAVQSGELLANAICFECYEHILEELETSINSAEQIKQDYADNLRSMEEETRASIASIADPS